MMLLYIALAFLSVVIGLVCMTVGIASGLDPEGRGGNYILLLPLGFVIASTPCIWAIWKLAGWILA